MHTVYLGKAELPAHLHHLLGSKQMLTVHLGESVTMPFDAGTWSGGTREIYSAVELASGRAVSITDTLSAPWDAGRRNRQIALKPGYAVAVTGSFCGKPATTSLYCLPCDVAPMLPAPAPALDFHCLVVLDACSGLISSARKDEYRRQGLSDAEVAAATATLVTMGYLKPRGGVTVAGMNARVRNPARPKPFPQI